MEFLQICVQIMGGREKLDGCRGFGRGWQGVVAGPLGIRALREATILREARAPKGTNEDKPRGRKALAAEKELCKKLKIPSGRHL